MDAKAEAKALADSIRHAKEFREKHNVSDDEWQLALAHQVQLEKESFDTFWNIWIMEAGNGSV